MTSTLLLRGRRGADGPRLALVMPLVERSAVMPWFFAWRVWHLETYLQPSHAHTHTQSFHTHNPFTHTQSFHTHTHTTLSHTHTTLALAPTTLLNYQSSTISVVLSFFWRHFNYHFWLSEEVDSVDLWGLSGPLICHTRLSLEQTNRINTTQD